MSSYFNLFKVEFTPAKPKRVSYLLNNTHCAILVKNGRKTYVSFYTLLTRLKNIERIFSIPAADAAQAVKDVLKVKPTRAAVSTEPYITTIAEDALHPDRLLVALTLTPTKRVVASYDVITRRWRVIVRDGLDSNVLRMSADNNRVAVLAASGTVNTYSYLDGTLTCSIPKDPGFHMDCIRMSGELLLAKGFDTATKADVLVIFDSGTCVRRSKVDTKQYLDMCIDRDTQDIYMVGNSSVKIAIFNGPTIKYLNSRNTLDMGDIGYETDSTCNSFSVAFVDHNTVRGFWKYSDVSKTAETGGAHAVNVSTRFFSVLGRVMDRVSSILPAPLMAFVHSAKDKARMLQMVIERHAIKQTLARRHDPASFPPGAALPIYALMGHGNEDIVTPVRIVVPAKTTIVMFAQCGESTYADKFCRLLDLFRDKSNERLFNNPQLHLKELCRLIRVTFSDVKIYLPGMTMPNLSYDPFAVHPTNSLPCGVKEFPYVSSYFPRRPLVLQTNECLHYEVPITETDVPTPQQVNQLFEHSLYPTPADVMAAMASHGTKTMEGMSDTFFEPLIDTLHRIGPGIYYYSQCRSVPELGEAIEHIQPYAQDYFLDPVQAFKFYPELEANRKIRWAVQHIKKRRTEETAQAGAGLGE